MATIISVPDVAEGGEEALQWSAVEKLPTFDRLRTTVLTLDIKDHGRERPVQMRDVTKITAEDRQQVVDRILRVTDEDNERFLRKLRGRLDRVGLDLPTIEVRYDHLKVEAEVYQESRATPSLPNFFKSVLEWPLQKLGISKKLKVDILSDISGILKPSRLTLLLGPPGSGRTTLLRALAGRLSRDLQVSGEITYNGHHMNEFVPLRTAAYISEYDLQLSELTVRENLDFYCRVQGVGDKYDMLEELTRREKEAKVTPESDVDFYMKATAVSGQSTNFITAYVMKLMGLNICADTRVGNAMRRGISGGQKKRVTTAEMLVGPAKAFFMDEISTGLDSSTTFEITQMLQQIVHVMDNTIVISLLQPPPETYALFDDLILLAEGQIVYQGPCSGVLDFMAFMGFKCPHRKATADFLQEITSFKDQGQFWADKSVPYEYVPVSHFVEGFKKFHVTGQTIAAELATPYEKSQSHRAALVHKKYGLRRRDLLKACFEREAILMKRNIGTYVSKLLQVAIIAFLVGTLFLRTRMYHDTVDHANMYMGAIFYGLIFIMTAGIAELNFTVIRLPTYHKEKELCLYPAWALSLPMVLLRIPWTLLESGLYLIIVYFVIGFAPEPGRFFVLYLVLILINQATIAMFRFAAIFAGTPVGAENLGIVFYTTTVLLGGFVISIESLPKWWKWASWYSILRYGQDAISLNEFLSAEWDKPFGNTTLGVAALQNRGLRNSGYWVWISVAALFGFIILFNILLTLALQYKDPPLLLRSGAVEKHKKVSEKGIAKTVLHLESPKQLERASPARVSCSSILDNEMCPDEARLSTQHDGARLSLGLSIQDGARLSINYDGVAMPTGSPADRVADPVADGPKGMVLPFRPLSISFRKINYFVDMPETMKEQGGNGEKLQLLNNVSGAFRPGVLTALVGVSGAGKTTLMDVLAGRKTRGYIDGDIFISGYPKEQSTFTRMAGYCEQTDIHSPNVTVFESLIFSAWMRLSPEVDKQTRMMFVEEVMSLVELDVIRDSIVGQPGNSGLSTEQRKRLTIAVELVANPSIIFMDEPTSGLDARAAAIVMRAVRNIGDTGRTIVCTIHQPTIEIFEAFDELLLLKGGGETIYGGSLGRHSQDLIQYFEAIPGVPNIKEGYNPATWMLEVSSASMETKLGVSFAKIYRESTAYQNNTALVEELSRPTPRSKDLAFPTAYAQSFWVQLQAGLWKMNMCYWRNTEHTGVKFLFVIFLGLLLGSIFWGLGKKRGTQQDVFNLMGATYCTLMFLGFEYTITIQRVIAIERTVYYRERAAGMYSPWAYAISQFLIEWPYTFVQGLLFTTIAYSMIQYEWRYDKFLYFFFVVYCTLLLFCYLGMVTVVATSNPVLAIILATSIFSVCNLVSGFIITKKQIPVWWRWLYWCTPHAWSFYGLIGSQLGDVETLITKPDNMGQQITLKEYLGSYFGFEHSFLKFVAIEQVLVVASFAITFSLCIKYLNFQRR